MKSIEAQSKLLGIRLSAEQVEAYVKELSAIHELEGLLLYTAYQLILRWSPEEIADKTARRDFITKCENFGLVKDDTDPQPFNEQPLKPTTSD